MERAVAKVKAHKGGGAENAAYIGRPQDERDQEVERQLSDEPAAVRGDRLAEMRETATEEPIGRAAGRRSDEDPVWGWNVPWFISGNGHGIWGTKEGKALLNSKSLSLPARHLGLGPSPRSVEKLTVGEKRENLVAHFSAMADLEERRGGVSHFRIILTVGREVSIRELKALVNAFLRENFPLCPAFVAVHDDTEHRHAHVYVHARQLDNRRVNLGQDYFRLDESWMNICSKQLDGPGIYKVHIALKEETLRWKEREEKARSEGKSAPPKPDRWGDHHDTLLIFRPFDDRWCGRLLAQTRVAETKVAWLEATKAKAEEVDAARARSRALRERLDSTAERRIRSKRESKRAMPAEVVTVSEARELILYERDIRRAEKREKKFTREQGAPGRTDTQAVLLFDELAGKRGDQLGFDFGVSSGAGNTDVSARTPAGTIHEPPKRGLKVANMTPMAGAGVSHSTDAAARSLGRELVAEARLAYIEQCLTLKKPRKEREHLKAELIAARKEQTRARGEAQIHRAGLAAEGIEEPPYILTEDDRSYLKVLSRHVPEHLRERIEKEVARAQIAPDRERGAGTRQTQGSAPHAQVTCPGRADTERHPAAENELAPQPKSAKLEEPARGTIAPADSDPHTKLVRQAAAQTLPEEDVRRLSIAYELAQGRAAVLRAEEKSFAVSPQHWVALAEGVTLAQVEQQIVESPGQENNVERLYAVRESVRDEIAAERVNLPLRIQQTEEEVSALEQRVRVEAGQRKRLGLNMPDLDPSPEELSEMTLHAVNSLDPRRLERVYGMEVKQALRAKKLTGDAEPIRRLEEKYASVELIAEVRADRSQQAISAATHNPEKIVLPAKDEAGRDLALTLEQAGTQKGVTGFLKKIVRGGESRRLREQLIEAKDAHLNYLRSDSAARTAFHEAAQEIALKCRERSGQLGYRASAVPALSREEIAEVRDNARFLIGDRRERWFAVAIQSQRMADERDAAAAPQRRPVEVFLPNRPSGSLAEAAREEIAQERARLERLIPAPSRSPVERERPSAPTPYDREDRSSHTRPKSGRGRGR